MLTRKVTDFIKLEEGNISKKSALTVGAVLAIAVGGTGTGLAWPDFRYIPYSEYSQTDPDWHPFYFECMPPCGPGELDCALWCTGPDWPEDCSYSHCC